MQPESTSTKLVDAGLLATQDWVESQDYLSGSENETITASLWDFHNNVHIGSNKSAGIANYDTVTLLGDWNGRGGSTLFVVDDDAQSMQAWADSLQIWRPNGYEDGDDTPRMVTSFGNDGSIWAANGNFIINSDGSVSSVSNNLYWDYTGSLTALGGFSTSYLNMSDNLYMQGNNIIEAGDVSVNQLTVGSGGISLPTGDISMDNITLHDNGAADFANGSVYIGNDGSFSLPNFQIDADGTVHFENAEIDSDGNLTLPNAYIAFDGLINGQSLVLAGAQINYDGSALFSDNRTQITSDGDLYQSSVSESSNWYLGWNSGDIAYGLVNGDRSGYVYFFDVAGFPDSGNMYLNSSLKIGFNQESMGSTGIILHNSGSANFTDTINTLAGFQAYNAIANDGNPSGTFYGKDDINSNSTDSNGDNYGYNLSGYGLNGFSPYSIGTGTNFGISYGGASGYNSQYPTSWNINEDAVQGDNEQTPSNYYFGGDGLHATSGFDYYETGFGINSGSASGNVSSTDSNWYIGSNSIFITNEGATLFQVDSFGNLITGGIQGNGITMSQGKTTIGDWNGTGNEGLIFTVSDNDGNFYFSSPRLGIVSYITDNGAGNFSNGDFTWDSSGNITAPTLKLSATVSRNYANDSAAATAGIPVGGIYHTAGVLKIRLS